MEKYGEIKCALDISNEFIKFRKSNPVRTTDQLKKFFFDQN